jgi:hypothetical protein
LKYITIKTTPVIAPATTIIDLNNAYIDSCKGQIKKLNTKGISHVKKTRTTIVLKNFSYLPPFL